MQKMQTPLFSKTQPVRGFSLLELIIAIAVMALLVVSAAPALNYISSYGALNSAKTQFASALQLARSRAIRDGQTIHIINRSGSASSDNEFGDGIVVYADANGNGSFNVGEEIFLVADLVNVNIDAEPDFTQLSFSPTGRIEQSADKYWFEICRQDESEGYQVEVVSKSGSVLVKNKGNCNVTAPSDGDATS